MARAYSGPETAQVVLPITSAVDALGSLVSGEPYELFELDWKPVERGSFECLPAAVAPGQSGCLIIDDGDGNLVDPGGAVVGGIHYSWGNGRFWLLRRVAAMAPDSCWHCKYRYEP